MKRTLVSIRLMGLEDALTDTSMFQLPEVAKFPNWADAEEWAHEKHLQWVPRRLFIWGGFWIDPETGNEYLPI